MRYTHSMAGYNFYTAIIIFCVGVAAATVYPISIQLMVLGMLVSLAVAVLWRRNYQRAAAPYVLLVSIVLCSLSVGLLRSEIFSWQFGQSPLEEQVDEKVTVVGVVVNEPDVRVSSVILHVKTDTDTILVSTDRLSQVQYGDEVAITGTIQIPESFETELGRTFDYVGYLKAKNIEYTMGFAEVEVLATQQGNPLIDGLLTVKHAFMDKLELVLPEPQVGLSEGLLLGVKQALGEDIETDFRETGIIHIVVLSGYNVMLVVAFFVYFFSFFLSPKKRVVGGIIAITAFALLVGLSATVVRASIMACLLLFAQGFGQQYNVMRALFFAGAVMLLLNPYLLLYDIGFQLSFMATLGLLLITPHFETSYIIGGRAIVLSDFFFATLATQIAVLPLLLFHIGEVSLVSLVVNVLVLPVVPVAMFLTFITGIIGFVSVTLSSMVSFFAYLSLSYILFIAHYFAQLPFAAVGIPEFSGWALFVSYVGIGVGLWFFSNKSNDEPFSGWVIEEESDEQKSPVVFFDKKTTGDTSESLPKIFR